MAKSKNKLTLALALGLCLTLSLPALALSEEIMALRNSGKELLQSGKYSESIEALKKAYFQSGKDDLIAKDLAAAYFARAKTHEADPNEMLDDVCIATFYDNDARDIVLLKGKAISRLYGIDWDKQAADAAKALEDGKPEVAIVLATELIYAQGASESKSRDVLQAALKKLELKVWPKNWEREKIDYSHYMNTVSTWLRGAWAPPSSGKSSRVEVSFNVKRNGTIKNLRVIQSANNSITDKAAMDAVKLAEPFRPFEKGWPEEVTIEFNFDYNQHANVSEAEKEKYFKNSLEGLRYFEEGKRAFGRKDYDLAIKKFQEAADAGNLKSRAFFIGKVVDSLLSLADKQISTTKDDDPITEALKNYFKTYYLEPDYWLTKEKISIALGKSGTTPVDTVKKFSEQLDKDADVQASAGAYRWLSDNGCGTEYKDKYEQASTRIKFEQKKQ